MARKKQVEKEQHWREIVDRQAGRARGLRRVWIDHDVPRGLYSLALFGIEVVEPVVLEHLSRALCVVSLFDTMELARRHIVIQPESVTDFVQDQVVQ